METAFEKILTNQYKNDMIAYMEAHPEAFTEAIQLAVSDKPKYAWRSAWLLCCIMKRNDQRIQKFIKHIVSVLPYRNDNHQRELIKILLEMEIDEESEGLLFDHCVSLWESIKKRPSIRITALKMMMKIAKRHPDLEQEIRLLVQEQHLDSLTPGIKQAVVKMMNP